MTEAEKKSYVLSFLEDPLIPASLMLVTFVNALQSGLNSKEEASLLLLFLKSRINSLIEEITRVFDESGTSFLLFSEHMDVATNYLLHLPDIISNLFPDLSLSFFSYQTYVTWFTEHLMQVYFCFSDNSDSGRMKRLVKKSCILGFVKSIGVSFCSILHGLAGENETHRDMIRSLSRKFLITTCRQFLLLIPELRMNDFVLTVLLDVTQTHHSSQFRAILYSTVFLSSSFITHTGHLIVRYSFNLSTLIELLHSLYQQTLMNSPDSSVHSLSHSLTMILMSEFASSSFIHLSSSQQIQLTSIIYCLLSLSHFYNIPPHSSDILSLVTQAVGNRLSTENPQVRSIVIGIARIVASYLTPEKQYEWPSVNLTELDTIVTKLKEVMTDKPDSEDTSVDDMPADEIASISTTPPISKYLDPDEIINIFIEEENRLLNTHIPEELTDSSSCSDDEDEFLPYDLTEETVRDSDYSHLEDAIHNLSCEDHYLRLKVWDSIVSLVRSDECLTDPSATSSILGVLLELNGLVGCEPFWDQWQEVISIIVYRQCDVSMTQVFKFVRENGRNNLMTVKCLALLQAISQAAKMLFVGSMNLQETNPIPQETPISITTYEDDGMIRVAKTKYRPSYYRKQIQLKAENQKSINAGIPEKKSKNEYSKVSQSMTEPLLTWCLRFPPRDEACIACLLYTLSFLFSLPVLTAVFDSSYRDLAAVILRYRFHKSAQIRRGSLELFLSTTHYEYRENTSQLTAELYEKKRVIEWMNRVINDDPDEMCRDLASRILSQLVRKSFDSSQTHSHNSRLTSTFC